MGNLKNFATGTVLVAPSPATSGTSLQVQSGEGAAFPTAPFYATVWPDNTLPTLANAEVVLVTAKSTDTFTITRAQKEPTAKSIAVNWRISNAIFAEDLMNGSMVYNEVPGGSVNGSNTAFTIAGAGKVTGSLAVYKNGVRMKNGGADFTETSGGFTMTTAPATNTVLLCEYRVGSTSDYSVGSNSTIVGEVPTGSINGSNTVFTTARAYIAGTVDIKVNGLSQARTTHFTETTPTSGTITLGDAPQTGDIVTVDYQYNLNPSSNADTVDGFHAADLMPVGSVLPYAGINAPSGNWLFAYGQAISRTTYADLFAALSTTYGSGDGSTTFNLPDLRGRVPAGQDDMGGSSANRLTNPGSIGGIDGDILGNTGGQETHTMTSGELVAHTHTPDGGGGAKFITVDGTATTQTNIGSGSYAVVRWNNNAQNTGSTGSTTPFNVVQPTIILNYIIKAL